MLGFNKELSSYETFKITWLWGEIEIRGENPSHKSCSLYSFILFYFILELAQIEVRLTSRQIWYFISRYNTVLD